MTRPLARFSLLFSLVLLLSSCRGWRADPETVAELEECIAEEMERQHIPALSILIFNGQEVKYAGLFGESDLGQGLALADDHLFLLASISKTITATALLQLYDQGLFALDDPINDHLPFAATVPGRGTPITFRMLLAHTSGIADGSALDGQYYYGEDSPGRDDHGLSSAEQGRGADLHQPRRRQPRQPAGTRVVVGRAPLKARRGRPARSPAHPQTTRHRLRAAARDRG